MDSSSLQKVINKIHSEYPKTRGCFPKVSKQADDRHLLIFCFTDILPGQKSLRQNLRVVIDNDGKILKKSISRG